MSTTEKKSGQLNFNSVMLAVTIATLAWNGTTTLKLVEKMSRVETLIELTTIQNALVEKRVVAVEGLLGIRPKP